LVETPQYGLLPLFLKDVKTLYALLGGAIPVLPAALSAPGYFFPPLGDVTDVARFFVVIVAVALVFASFWLNRPHKMMGHFVKLIISTVVLFLLYLLALTYFVVRIDRTADNSTIYLSVGFEKTQEAVRRFGASEGDAEMIKNTGVTDNDLELLWTRSSIYVARICLFLSYLGVALSLVLIFSSGVRYLSYPRHESARV
jgi:hypothetical protein